MLSLLGSAVSTGALVSLGGVNAEAMFMYSLLAFVIGLIAWSKYNEPSPSNPYPNGRSGLDLLDAPGDVELGPVVPVPVVSRPVRARKQL